MRQIPNFSSVEEVMEQAEGFYRQAAKLCEANATNAANERDRMFFGYAAAAARSLVDDLHTNRSASETTAHQAYMQYTSEQSAPDEDALPALQSGTASVPEALQELEQATNRWVSIFEELQDRAPTPESQELHVGCSELLEVYARELTTGHAQGADM